jgi:hypothetical protein
MWVRNATMPDKRAAAKGMCLLYKGECDVDVDM